MKNINPALKLPDFTIIKASAGTGKTHSLTKRFLSILLDKRIKNASLANILAVTFSNAAAKEMKERILDWLKRIYFLDKDVIKELSDILSEDESAIKNTVSNVIDNIFTNYSDFQIRTIDSFSSTLLRASAVDLGFSPDFEILIKGDEYFAYAFDLLLKNFDTDPMLKELIFDAIKIISELRKDNSSFLWDPSVEILEQMKMLHREISVKGKEAVYKDLGHKVKETELKIKEKCDCINLLIKEAELDNYRHRNSGFIKICDDVKSSNFISVLSRGLNTAPLKKLGKEVLHLEDVRIRVNEVLWMDLRTLIGEYAYYYAKSFFVPYIKIFNVFEGLFKDIKNKHDKVLIEDINKSLLGYIREDIIPDIYIRLGEKIYHYLIDEFQDTSLSQWNNLTPLIENSLSQSGSLFMVGDTKQAIFGFRDADFKIMKNYASGQWCFASVKQRIEMLNVSYRSYEAIVKFNNLIFKEKVASDKDYGYLAQRSGLTDFFQDVKEDYKDKGFVDVKLCQKNDDEYEKELIYNAIDSLKDKGYSFGDIAVLTSKNDDVVKVSMWLNEKSDPVAFVSFSDLDVRQSFVAKEFLAFLGFLNSPIDDLSFATFILGHIFEKTVIKNNDITKQKIDGFFFRNRESKPKYVLFKKEYAKVWEKYFEGLFKSVGYMPLYDIATEFCRAFDIFNNMPGDEASVVKLLEVIKNFEDNGNNSLHDFLDFANDQTGDGSEWNIALPEASDAVKIMTMHKSKGLGFKAVIVLLYEERAKGFSYIPLVSDDASGTIEFLKITKSMPFNEDCEYSRLYEEYTEAEKISSLNKLYVALTRAKEAMFVIGVCKDTDKPLYPLSFFSTLRIGELCKTNSSDDISSGNYLRVSHNIKKPVYQEREAKPYGRYEKRRGDIIHGVLQKLTFADSISLEEIEAFAEEIIKVEREDFDHKEISKAIYDFINTKEVLPYFTSSVCDKVLKEASFADEKGNLKRMDRVVFFKSGEIAVLDYKTGSDSQKEAYAKQVKNYVSLLESIYPHKKVSGKIGYIDLKQTEAVI